MSLLINNGTTHENSIGSAAIAATNVAITTAGISGSTTTAPNTTNKITGVPFYINALPTSGNLTLEIMESGVSVGTVTCNLADLQLGWNYARYTTPYQFTTTGAGAYTVRVKNTSANSGSLAIATTNLFYLFSYDTSVTPGVGDDVILCGWHNAGLTPKTYTYSGTSGSWGSGADTAIASTTQRSIGCALMIGNGGNFVFNNTGVNTLQLKGAMYPTVNGLFDMRPSSSDVTKINTLIFDQNGVDGNYGILIPGGGYGGYALTTGATVNTWAQFGSGLGTAASPVITQATHNLHVNDEMIFGGATDYLKNEKRFVISIPAANQLVLSNTLGGTENALTQTHAAGSYIGNLTRNSIIKNTDTTHGFWIMNSRIPASPVLDLNYTRAEFPNCSSGKALQLEIASTTITNFDGFVLYNNAVNARSSISLANTVAQTINNVILYNTKGTNYSGQSGLALQTSNKTINFLLHFADPSSTTNCAGLSLSAATNNVINHFHSYGANASNGAGGYALSIQSSNNNTINNSTIDGSRVQAIQYAGGADNVVNNSNFGLVGNNAIDVQCVASVYNTGLFNNSGFGSTTVVSGSSTMLPGSLLRFHKFNQTDNRHRWYDINGISYSSGAGLDKTVVATVGSLGVATDPLTAAGTEHIFPFPVAIGEVISKFGKFWCNSTFSADSGCTLVAELYLPGSLTGSPDQTVTLTKTTDPTNNNAIWRLGLVNTSTVRDVARVRLVAKNSSGTAGAEAYYDDMDGGTNPITALDIWYQGQPAAFRLMPQTLGDSAAAAAAILGDTSTWPTNSIGKKISDTKTDTSAILSNTDATQAKVNML